VILAYLGILGGYWLGSLNAYEAGERDGREGEEARREAERRIEELGE
jgi:hypothetical protein